LLEDGKPLSITPRAFDVLVALVERAGEIVSKDTLLKTAWPGLVVEENNLQVQVSTLRKLLGPQTIATIPGRGYRFATTVDRTEATEFAGRKDSACVNTGLPAGTSDQPPIYGRDEDLLTLRDMISSHALVTIVGPAGIGKTCVAEAVASDTGTLFPDGVRLVEFAQLADPTLVPATVSRALSIAVGDPASALELTVQALAGRRMLLVLDNCEHLLDSVGSLVSALRKNAGGVHVLVTSQEVLRHPDEHVYRLGPLAIPIEATVASARDAGATALFVARVHALDPRFSLSDGNVGAVIDICRRLDGIPLALELAAARVPFLGLEGVRERLDERFRLLTAGSRLALRKHQTLRAALEWSYSLLSPTEQRIFDRLGVFAGGFSLEAAQQLAADDEIGKWDILDDLGALVNKSLVIAELGSVTRFKLLETTRAFALERLATRHDTANMLRRHAEVMRALFERYWGDLLVGVPVKTIFATFAPDLDNLRGAIRWAMEADHRTAVALVGATGAGYYLDWMQLNVEGWRWCKKLKPFVDELVGSVDAARFWLACAELGTETSLEESAEAAHRAIAMYGTVNDQRGLYQAWNALLYSRMLAGRLDEALYAFEEAGKCLDASWPAWFRAILPNRAGMLFAETGQEGKARECFLEQLALNRQCANPSGELSALGLLVDLEVQLGRQEQAVDIARDIVSRYRPDLGFDSALCLRNSATALMSAGALEEAEVIYREALAAARRNYGTGAFVLDDMATLLARRGRIDDAARVSAYAEHAYPAQRRPRLVARRNRERLLALVTAERSTDALAKLLNEGRRLTEDEACALASPPAQPPVKHH
jgi:predicted ATPase